MKLSFKTIPIHTEAAYSILMMHYCEEDGSFESLDCLAIQLHWVNLSSWMRRFVTINLIQFLPEVQMQRLHLEYCTFQ